MQLSLEFRLSVPKDAEHPESNEDVCASNEACMRFAISDGATESFDSRTWANQLVNSYCDDTCFSFKWVQQALSRYVGDVNYDSLSWSKQAAFDRGSFATLLGVELSDDGSAVNILAVGDSVAFQVFEGELKASFPYTTPEEFDARPRLLSTVAAHNAFLNDPATPIDALRTTWTVKPGDHIYLATDAVAQWIMQERDSGLNAVQELYNIQKQEDFELLVVNLRQQRRMRLDDSTLVCIVVAE